MRGQIPDRHARAYDTRRSALAKRARVASVEQFAKIGERLFRAVAEGAEDTRVEVIIRSVLK